MKKPAFLKQKMMMKVVYALIPVLLTAIYFFGWRVAAVVAVSTFFAVLTEWIMSSNRKGKISQAVYVTALLYGLSLPPTVPFWIAAVGAVVAILFAKEVFGGFGKNVFNPAIVGRAFVYVSFPQELTSRFVPAFQGIPGGFKHWSFESLKSLPAYLQQADLSKTDAITAATPMWARRDYGFVTDLKQLLFGNINGVFEAEGTKMSLAAGSAGEVCALVIILAGIYLLATKTAKWQLTLSTILGAVGLNVLLRNVFGISQVPPVLFTLLSGGFLFAAVFMVTDPISAPKQQLSQWLYGILIGGLIVFFRYKAIFAGGVGFAILIGNMFAPSFDLWIKRAKASKKGA
ncbi:MAG: RnfABCDGE type electron transport complex subunit D [Fidelibacterota bacterium]